MHLGDFGAGEGGVAPSPAPRRNPTPRFALNTALVFASQGVSRVIGFAYMLYLARSLAPEDFGAMNIALSLLMIADVALDCGVSRLLVRDLSRTPDAAPLYLSRLLPFRLMMAVVAYAVCVAIVTITGYPTSVAVCIAIIGIGLVFTGSASLLESVLQANHRFGSSALAHLTLILAQAGLGVAVVQLGGSLVLLASTFLVANILYAATMLVGVRLLGIRFPFRIERDFIVKTVIAALPFAGIGILFALSMKTELLVLSWYAAPPEVGIFSAASKFNDAAMIGPVVLLTVLTPLLSREAATDPEQMRRSFEQTIRYGLLAALPGTAAAILLTDHIIPVVLPNYQQAAGLVKVLFAAFPFFALYCVTLALLTATSSQHVTLMFVLALNIVQLVMAVIVISRFGATGAAASFVAWTVMAAVTSLMMACKIVLRWRDLIRSTIPAVMSALVLGAVLWFGWDMHLALILPLALASYGLVAAATLRVVR